MSNEQKQKTVNGVNTKGLSETIEQIKAEPSLGRCEFRVSNKWINGGANQSKTHGFYAAGGEQEHV